MRDLTIFEQNFAVAPIILVAGIAQDAQNHQMLITDLLQSTDFATFKVTPGGTIVDWEYAEYPFANMVVAANAGLMQPLRVSLEMICPAQSDPTNNYLSKLNTLTSLQNQIQNHISQGGYFQVNTPGYVYQNILLTKITDMTGNNDKQVQAVWKWDFAQPLIDLAAATTQLNNFMNNTTNGTPTQTNWNGSAAPFTL